MLFKLIVFFFFSQNIYATLPSPKELEEFAYSKAWLNLYLYKKSIFSKEGMKSKSVEKNFFFSKDGMTSPLAELKSSILAFNDHKKKWGHIQKTSQCAYPARYQRVKRRWPRLFKQDQICKDFESWKKKINAHKISLIYAGAYPNNPASMFGHTILKIHNRTKNELLDYNIGFQAMISPNDNPVTYTLKGLFGGYPGFYNIRPYYLNIGLYNNAESRDLWIYELDFKEAEVEFFIKHLWEVSLNTGFPYYFLDENCSYFLLTLFEAVRPSLSLTESLNHLIYPIEALKLVVNEDSKPKFRAAIKRVLKDKLKRMNKSQKKDFDSLKENKEEIKDYNDVLVLDSLIDFWKLKNYKSRTHLKSVDKELMDLTLKRRSKIAKISSYLPITSQVSPRDVHSPSKIEIGYKNTRKSNFLRTKVNWGYHGKNDSEVGYSRRSFIDFIGIEFLQGKGQSFIEKINILEIYSLENFNYYFPQISWNISLNIVRDCFNCNQNLYFVPKSGIGLSIEHYNLLVWSFLGIKGNTDLANTLIYPELELGMKSTLNHFIIGGSLEVFYRNDINYELKVSSSYYLKRDLSLNTQIEYTNFIQNISFTTGFKLHF